MTHQSPETGYVTPGEAVRQTGLSLKTLARLADRGEIEAYELPSGHRRYLRSSIEQLVRPKRAAS